MKLNFVICMLLLCLAPAAKSSHQTLGNDDPWSSSELLAPSTLAERLKTLDPQLHIVSVGPRKSYKGTHIPRSVFVGPVSKLKSHEVLADALKNIPHDAEIVIYCGCCPFISCPNIRPAYTMLRGMGFVNIKVLKLNTDLDRDWSAKGFPVELSTS